MPDYTYLIIGGGMTGDAAIGGIREVDASGSVGLISADSHRPYDRPPLSKGLWKGKPLESIWRKTDRQGVTLHLGRRALTLDPPTKRVTDDQGTVYTFDKLLLATGGTPRRLSFGGDDIIYYRTLDDYERLRALTGQCERYAVVGSVRRRAQTVSGLAVSHATNPVARKSSRLPDRRIAPPPVATTWAGRAQSSRRAAASRSRNPASPSVAKTARIGTPAAASTWSSQSANPHPSSAASSRPTVVFPVPR